MIESYKNCPWAFDVWSLGIILLEIATGCPVEITKKCLIANNDAKEIFTNYGFLGSNETLANIIKNLK